MLILTHHSQQRAVLLLLRDKLATSARKYWGRPGSTEAIPEVLRPSPLNTPSIHSQDSSPPEAADFLVWRHTWQVWSVTIYWTLSSEAYWSESSDCFYQIPPHQEKKKKPSENAKCSLSPCQCTCLFMHEPSKGNGALSQVSALHLLGYSLPGWVPLSQTAPSQFFCNQNLIFTLHKKDEDFSFSVSFSPFLKQLYSENCSTLPLWHV